MWDTGVVLSMFLVVLGISKIALGLICEAEKEEVILGLLILIVSVILLCMCWMSPP